MARRVAVRLPINVLSAEYRPGVLPEHVGNPLIEALPPQVTGRELTKRFGRFPVCAANEHDLPAVVRMQAVSRLDHYLQPLPQHVEVIDTLNLVLRGGYVHRSPLNDNYRKEQMRLYRLSLDGDIHPLLQAAPSTAPSFGLFGISGVGKSTVIEQTLSFFPPALSHRKYGFVQVVWLKLDCPADGSLKQLLYALLVAIDNLIGTNYKPLTIRETATDKLILEVAKIASRHYLGVLVIDEIQNLLAASGVGIHKLLNFFVMFSNVAKIPVVIVGTPQALGLLEGTFHEARRAGNYGTLVWDRMQQGPVWDLFLKSLFSFWWAKHRITIDKKLSTTLHYLTQGIHALVVRLSQLTQLEVIQKEKAGEEVVIGPELFKTVAGKRFRLIKPMLDALRGNKLDQTKKYDDLLIKGLPELEKDVEETISLAILEEQHQSRQQSSVERLQAASSLGTLGFDQTRAKQFVDRLFETDPSMSAALAVRRVLEAAEPNVLAGKASLDCSLKLLIAEALPGQDPVELLRTAGLVTAPNNGKY
ncbi:ATP-binding protein [Microvirga sp. M2]|uniref:ATP-binding protein n=1 Tax=Microvirga sp. M2 TaxID=3073270 RepID=UPI0039C236D8